MGIVSLLVGSGCYRKGCFSKSDRMKRAVVRSETRNGMPMSQPWGDEILKQTRVHVESGDEVLMDILFPFTNMKRHFIVCLYV